MLRRVVLVITDVSEERSSSIRVTIAELGTTIAVNSPILVTLMKEALSSFETSLLTRTTRRSIQKTPFFIVTAAVETSARGFSRLVLVSNEF
jgi:hypothetical protein